LKGGKLERVQWFKLRENVFRIKSIHKNWLIVDVHTVSRALSSKNRTFIYNLQDTCPIGVNAQSSWGCYLVSHVIPNSIKVLVPKLKHDPLRLSLKSEQIDAVTSFQKHIISWPLDQTWKDVSIPSCTMEPYANSFILYTNESQSKLAILQVARSANAQTISYNGVLRCVSSMDARAYIEDENNSWYIIDLNSRDKTYIGNTSISTPYLGMAIGKYIIVSCRDTGFFVLAERRRRLTKLYRVPTSSSADDVDDIAIVCTKPDGIEIIDFSGLIDSTA
jgi:hypothetical protein